MTRNLFTHKAQALWITGRAQSDIRATDVPAPRDRDVLVRALQSGISRGTEALVFAGQVPEGEWARMRCPFQEGEFPFPVKYGYASVGVIEDGPADRLGQRVFCLYPHQTFFTLPADAAIPVPDNVPTSRAVLAAQIETVLNATWDLAPRIGDRIAVVGGGTIGCLAAWLCAQLPGTEVTLIDVNPARAMIAEALDVRFAQGHEAPRNCDAVIHASGSGDGLSLALSLAGFEADVMELSWYGDKAVTVPLGGAFHSQRLSLRSSQVGMVSPSRRARWSHARRLGLALSLAADPRLDCLVREETCFDALPAALPGLLGQPGALFHRIIYPSE
ncbi:zinc-binding alcohol dehydrogenase [Acidisoma cellulosilytica]|uniref:Zinc-binding alcohol dehydrogenase n=1 Tax=Acidisoma cellulosilyticum TaxID=2802395 RepID=A0A964E6N2_9PROT|nr:zinc-binding alcohol dehydrogenase [Acidisoma cellulosilyticum]MCB8883637.1 zinc-binding alcohol dehydrogenase [Acidisoma cellulosilyticum]